MAWDVCPGGGGGGGGAKMPWDVLSRVTKKWHGIFCPWMFVLHSKYIQRGGKSMWDVLSGMSKYGMGCFVPECFVLHSK